MDKRLQQLSNIRDYIQNTNKDLTLLLQNLQWDHNRLLEKSELSCCNIDARHRMPEYSRSMHEQLCFLTQCGYAKDEQYLPDPVDKTANTIVKFSSQDVRNIINVAAHNDPLFKRGKGNHGVEPLTVERLQTTYTADERRVIYDAVVNAAPFAHDLTDLALGSNSQKDGRKSKSRLEIVAELRDMRRRRTKYRVSSKTTNYSDVLRDVIKTQMDLYAESNGIFIKTEYGTKSFVSLNDEQSLSKDNYCLPNVSIKEERVDTTPDNTRDRDTRYRPETERYSRHRYEDGTTSRDKDRHTHTRHVQERHDKYRSKNRETNKHNRSGKDYRIDDRERSDTNNKKRNEHKHDRNRSSSSNRDNVIYQNRDRYDSNKVNSSSRSEKYDRSYKKIRIKEEKIDCDERKKIKYK